MKKGTFVDVRTPEEYQEGHLENSINLPLDNIIMQIEDIEKMAQPIFLYCRVGNRSGQAVALIREASGIEATNIGGLEEAQEFYQKFING